MKELLKNLFDKYQIEYTKEQLEKLETFYEKVIETNKLYNLTAITQKEDFAVKHILDSVLPYTFLPQNASVIDVGVGAGFPSIPLKIMRPDIKITMLDSLNKRIIFLDEMIKLLNLSNAWAVHARAEDYAKEHREGFDVAVARAVANLTTLSEYCLPLVKTGGIFIALKGSSAQEELRDAGFAINELGAKVKQCQSVQVDEISAVRENIIIQKIKQTPPKYPRGKNLPRVKPLLK